MAGGSVYLEPESVITYLTPPPLALSDLPYFMLRWSHSWNTATLHHFQSKWKLAENDRFVADHRQWLSTHRLLGYRPWTLMGGLLRPEMRAWFERRFLTPMETALNRCLIGNTRHTWRDRQTGQDRVKVGVA